MLVLLVLSMLYRPFDDSVDPGAAVKAQAKISPFTRQQTLAVERFGQATIRVQE